MSSRLWNIHLTTAFFLFTLTGYPDSTAFLSTILSGLQLRREPARNQLNLQQSIWTPSPCTSSLPVIQYLSVARKKSLTRHMTHCQHPTVDSLVGRERALPWFSSRDSSRTSQYISDSYMIGKQKYWNRLAGTPEAISCRCPSWARWNARSGSGPNAMGVYMVIIVCRPASASELRAFPETASMQHAKDVSRPGLGDMSHTLTNLATDRAEGMDQHRQ